MLHNMTTINNTIQLISQYPHFQTVRADTRDLNGLFNRLGLHMQQPENTLDDRLPAIVLNHSAHRLTALLKNHEPAGNAAAIIFFRSAIPETDLHKYLLKHDVSAAWLPHIRHVRTLDTLQHTLNTRANPVPA